MIFWGCRQTSTPEPTRFCNRSTCPELLDIWERFWIWFWNVHLAVKKVPQSSNVLPARGPRFLAPNVEGVIPAQRRIRIFGKRFMESEMGSILVKVGEIFQHILRIYHEFRKVTVDFVQVFLW